MNLDACAGCLYAKVDGPLSHCEYILKTGRRRPCPAGLECTVYTLKEGGIDMPRRASFDKVRARELWDEGKSILEIADMVGCQESSVRSWAYRNGLRRQAVDQEGTRPEVTVVVPEGLTPAVRTEIAEAPPEPETVKVPEPESEPVTAPDPPPAGQVDSDQVEKVVEYVDGAPAGPDRRGEDERNQRLRTTEGRGKQSNFSEDDGTDPVSINIYCRGCSIRVDAACLSQLSAAGGLLAGLAGMLGAVPIMDTK